MAGWDKHPFLKLVPFFIAGILSGYFNLSFLGEYLLVLYCLLGVTVATIAISYKKIKQHTFWLISIAMLLLGAVTTVSKYDISQTNHFTDDNGRSTSYLLVIKDDVKESQFNYTAQAKVILKEDTKTNSWHNSTGNIYLTISKQAVDSIPKRGSRYLISHKLIEAIPTPLNPVKFNFKQYAATQNIFYQVKLKKSNRHQWKSAGNATGSMLQQLTQKLSSSISQKLETHFNQNAGLMQALLLGNRDNVSPDMKDNFIGLGVIHILAVSGLHVGILFLVLTWLLSGLKHLPKGYIWQPATVILLLWFYALLTGLSPSVIRAVTMFSFIAIGKVIYRTPNVYNAILVSAFVLLMFDPFMLFQLGFQLSYLAVLGIVFFYPKINSWVQPKYKLLKYIWSLLAVSLSAQLATFPLTIATFHIFPTYFLIGNLLILPLVTLLLSGGVIFMAVSFITPVARLLAKGLSFIVDAIAYLSDSINNNLPYSPWQQLYPNTGVLWILLITMVLVVYFITYRKAAYLKYSLVVLSTCLLLNGYHNYTINTRQKLVVLADDRTPPVLLIRGRSVQEISPSSASASYALNDLADLWKLERVLNKEAKEPIHQCGDKTFVMIDKALVLKNVTEPLPVDYLIVCDETDIGVKEILSNFTPKQVIIGSNVGAEIKQKWQQTSINVYDIDEKGYFEATI